MAMTMQQNALVCVAKRLQSPASVHLMHPPEMGERQIPQDFYTAIAKQGGRYRPSSVMYYSSLCNFEDENRLKYLKLLNGLFWYE